MAHHNLKTHAAYFDGIFSGAKTFEVRKNDRNFQVGDLLTLSEVDLDCTPPYVWPASNRRYKYTGRQKMFQISYIFAGDHALEMKMPDNWVVLGLRPPPSLKPISQQELGRIIREAVYGGNDELFGEDD